MNEAALRPLARCGPEPMSPPRNPKPRKQPPELAWLWRGPDVCNGGKRKAEAMFPVKLMKGVAQAVSLGGFACVHLLLCTQANRPSHGQRRYCGAPGRRPTPSRGCAHLPIVPLVQ